MTAMYHPTLGVHDLEVAREWFTRVFARPAFRWEDTLDPKLLDPDYPRNYSFFFFIHDLHYVVLCPQLHATGALRGQTRYQDVPEGMIGVGWYTDDAVGMFDRLTEHGITSHDQKGRRITSENPPVSPMAPDIHVGFTDPETAGYRHEFVRIGDRHLEYYSRQADPRLRPDWVRPPVDPNDPLRIERTSHHTFLTADPERAERVYVDAAGGRVIGQRRNEELQALSTFITLGDSVVEFAVPDPKSPAAARVSSGLDYYHGISLQVADIEQVETHLAHAGVPTRRLSTEVTSIDPEAAFGMQWRFITRRPI
ncbi:VOC family protein [Phytohabitans kaempferiae]|uniref:VOC family protein n=2 Tax=Phytohabitans kaempferiae TaxID=1620943 RepID=A0ABV6LW27_9ACTN